MTVSLNADVRARLDAHLDAVERALVAAGHARERRRGVVDDLEAQILDMLAGKSEVPTMQDLEGVLASLDPPAAYGAEGAARPAAVPRAAAPAKVRYSRAAIAGLVCILASFLPVALMVIVGLFVVVKMKPVDVEANAAPPGMIETGQAQTMPGTGGVPLPPAYAGHEASAPRWAKGRSFVGVGCIGFLALPLAIAGTLLGWIGFFQIRASKGVLRGTGMALFDGLFYPGLLLLTLPFLA